MRISILQQRDILKKVGQLEFYGEPIANSVEVIQWINCRENHE
ncbi:hypothetical protein ETSB_1182 [cyanobacterium endosymbiont of Epithemia turgida isolate EtSB Lake Yunoko]|nr:hypothetical protein ETSB_1182 [cyanobacterium endosymbiont of Epithemia turgida isolate EtSB Lake Yunoko]